MFSLDFQSMPLDQAIGAYDKQSKVPVHSGRVLRWGKGHKDHYFVLLFRNISKVIVVKLV
jgi:hypothetical protein